MPVGEIAENLLDEAAIDLTGLEVGTDRAGIGEALPDEEAIAARQVIDGDKAHGALLLFPQREGADR